MEKNKKLLRVIAGLCFIVYSVMVVIRNRQVIPLAFDGSFDFDFFMTFFGQQLLRLLIGIGLITSVPVLSAVGCGLLSLCQIVWLISDPVTVYAVLLLAYSVLLLLVMLLDPKPARILGIAAAAIAVVYLVLQFLRGKPTGFSLVLLLLLAAGALLAGFSAAEKRVRPVTAPVPTGNAPVAAPAADRIERLTRLKALLDNGTITPEEFTEKKRQLLE